MGPTFLVTCRSGLRALSQLQHTRMTYGYVEQSLMKVGVPEVSWKLHRCFAKLVSFPLAQTGEGISECELVAWAVKPGDVVNPFDKLCDVQSDKAAIEITSRYGGRVTALHHAVGAMVKVGAPLVDLEVADDVQVAAEHLAETAATPPTPAALSTTSSTDGASAADAAVTVTATKVAVHVATATVASASPTPATARAVAATTVPTPRLATPEPSMPAHSSPAVGAPGWGRARVQASPAVRAFARENGVDLALVTGTGPGGRITRPDVLLHLDRLQGRGTGPLSAAAAEDEDDGEGPGPVLQASDFLGAAVGSGAQEAAAGGGAGGGYSPRPGRGRSVEDLLAQYKRVVAAARVAGGDSGGGGGVSSQVVPLRGYRRAMVTSMTAAAAVPVFHFHDEVCCDRLLAVREVLRGDAAGTRAAGGGGSGLARLTVLPLIIKALSVALSQHPHINASLGPGGSELLLHAHHNIGVAMATPSGLVVPNIKQVERKSVAQVAGELGLLQQLAAAGRLPQEVLSGGTITISNIGSIGGTYATPLVAPPEVAIVALGRLQLRPRYPGTSPTRWVSNARWASEGLSSAGAALPPQPVPVTVMPVSWGADHRVVDGATLAAFSNCWRELLEAPEKMLLHLG